MSIDKHQCVRSGVRVSSDSANRDNVMGIMSFVAELWHFMRVRKKFWLLPVIVMSCLLGALIVLTQGSAVAPFIYTLF
jgi:hypothetical protein